MNAEIILGGASFAPNLCSLLDEAIAALSKPEYLFKASRIANKNIWNY
jgi:hypothetical protein